MTHKLTRQQGCTHTGAAQRPRRGKATHLCRNLRTELGGGAGGIKDFIELFNKLPKVDAGLAASIFHFGEVTIDELKRELKKNNINTRI